MRSLLGFEKKRLPEMLFMTALALLLNQFVYFGSKKITESWYHYDMTTELDLLIPLVPWTVIIYLGCYVFWMVIYSIASLQPRDDRNRFFLADNISKIICFVFFLAIPTVVVRPEITEGGLWGWAMRFLYSADTPVNLFPSIHCSGSWLCWIGVRKRKDIHVVCRYLILAMTVAICISTLTTKQHVWVDVIAGIALAEGSYLLAGISKLRAWYSRLIDILFRIFHLKQYSEI